MAQGKCDKLPIVEQFSTIQGEGFHTGKPAHFIRIAGCDLCCNWCDAKDSWKISEHSMVEVSDIINGITDDCSKSVVVTGGEPMLYDMNCLSKELIKNGYTTYLETSGSYPITGQWDWICVSPKKINPPISESLIRANEIKVVIKDIESFAWAEECSQLVSANCVKYLQPEWSQYNKIIHEIVIYVKLHPEWRISLQTHKFMNIP
jgi:7-carboxy-7-deazaguanine synthase